MEVDLSGVDLNLMVAFETLMRERSVTRAAAAMGVTQSAMSHTLRRLRELLDDPLLVRGRGGMLPTPRAEALRAPVRRGLLDLQRALMAPEGFDPGTARRGFTVACTDLMMVWAIPALLHQLRGEAPGVDLNLRPQDEARMFDALEDGSVDVAISVFDDPLPGMMSRKVVDETFACLARRGHPSIQGALSVAQMTALPHALISPSGHGRSVVDDALEALGLTRRVALRVHNFLAAPQLVAASDLLLTAPRRLCEAMAAQLPLQVLDPPLPLPPFSLHMIWHERFQHDPGHRWLRDKVVEACRAPLVTPGSSHVQDMAASP